MDQKDFEEYEVKKILEELHATDHKDKEQP